MKKLIAPIFVLLAASCQKELSLDTSAPQAGGAKQGLLEKMEVIDMPQNQVYLSYTFSYDDSLRISRINSSYVLPSGTTYTGQTVLNRDNLGRVSELVFTPDTLAAKAVFVYQGTTQKINYAKLMKIQGAALDSMVFSYQQEVLARTEQFVRQPNGQMKKIGYQEYNWDAKGNLLSKQTYQDNDSNGQFEASIKYSWNYDNNPNPIQISDPAIGYWSTFWPTGMSAHNVTRQMNKYPPNGGPDDELNYSYQYNAENKPTTQTKSGGGSLTRYTYYK